MTAELATTKTARLSRRLSVTITVGRTGMTCEWIPSLPAKLNAKEARRYREARNATVAEVAQRLGGMAVIVESNV